MLNLVPAPLPNPTITLMQVFNYAVPDPSVLVGNVSWVWGSVSQAPGNPAAPSPGTPSFVYWPINRNGEDLNNLTCVGCVTGGTNPAWDWFLAHHPNWIEYKSDEVTPAWENFTYNYVPMNIANPAVFNFVTTGAGSGRADQPARRLTSVFNGQYFAGVSLDNVSYENPYGYSGHFRGRSQRDLHRNCSLLWGHMGSGFSRRRNQHAMAGRAASIFNEIARLGERSRQSHVLQFLETIGTVLRRTISSDRARLR